MEQATNGGPGSYAESRSRPLARLLARIALPARVLIRARKPCLRARRRLLGWNVRFMSGLLGKAGDECAPVSPRQGALAYGAGGNRVKPGSAPGDEFGYRPCVERRPSLGWRFRVHTCG